MLKRAMSRFFVEFFLFHSAEKCRKESCSLSLTSDIEKVWMNGWCGGECQDFPWKISCLTVPKKFVGKPFRVSLILGIEKFYAEEGYVTIFVEFFVSQYQKNSQGNPSVLCFRKVSGSK